MPPWDQRHFGALANGKERFIALRIFVIGGKRGVMNDNVRIAGDAESEKAISLVKSSYAAYVKKDRAALEKVLADDFHFTSPLDNRLDRKTYFERCWPNSARIRDFDFVDLVTLDGRKVFVTYIGTNKD